MLCSLKRPFGAMLTLLMLLMPASTLAEEGYAESTAPAMPVPGIMPPGKPLPPDQAPESAPLAEIKVSRDEAVELVRKRFALPDDLGEPNVNIWQSRTHAVWNIAWYPTRKQMYEGLNIHAEVDAITGQIRNFNRSSMVSEEQPALSYTRDEALAIAREWLNKLAPEYIDQMALQENPMEYGFGYYGGPNAQYNFRWNRQAHGYVLREDGAEVAVNARTGELDRFWLNWRPELTFPKPEQEPDLERAADAYRSYLAMRLMYARFNKPGTEEYFWRLIYQPTLGYYPPITLDGQLADHGGNPLDLSNLPQSLYVRPSDKQYAPPEQPLTREQALAMARQVSGRTDEPTSSGYREWGEETKSRIWEFSWHMEREMRKGEWSVNVGIDIMTGLVAHYNAWTPWEQPREGERPKITTAQAEELAVAFIRQYRPDLAGSMMMLKSNPPPPEHWDSPHPMTNWYVRFQQLHNGIPVLWSETSVDVDLMTGVVRNFWANNMAPVDRERLPAAEKLLLPADAVESVLTHIGLTPVWSSYWRPAPLSKVPDIRPEENPPEMRLTIQPLHNYSFIGIDAQTGAPLDHAGRDMVELARRPEDIKGHFAEREIELFWARGIFEVKNGRFHPDEQATGADLARWLVLARGLQPYYGYGFAAAMGKGGDRAMEVGLKMQLSPSAPYWAAALQAGIIQPEDFTESINPDGPIPREMFALWAVRAMGYGRIARIPNSIAVPFMDAAKVRARFANAVGLLYGLGALQGGPETAFHPDRPITRGEAAKVVFAVANEPRR